MLLCTSKSAYTRYRIVCEDEAVFLFRAVDKIQKELKKSRDEHRKLLQEQHPVLSRISPWLRAKLEAGEQSKISKITWGAHEEALKIAQKHNLHQSVYFLTRDMAFMKEV